MTELIWQGLFDDEDNDDCWELQNYYNNQAVSNWHDDEEGD